MIKKFLAALAIIASLFAAPAFACGGNACPSTPTPEPTYGWTDNTGVWAEATTFGDSSTYGKAFGEGTGTFTRELGTTGFSEQENGSEFNVSNCGTCESGAFTGRVFGRGVSGQRSFSLVESDGGFVESGTVAQTNNRNGGTFSAWRGTSSGATAPAGE